MNSDNTDKISGEVVHSTLLGMFLFVICRLKGFITTKVMSVVFVHEQMGLYSILMTMGAVLWSLLGLNLHYAVQVYLPHYRESRGRIRSCYYTAFVLSVVMACLLVGGGVVSGVWGIYFSIFEFFIIFLFVLAKIFDEFGRAFLQAFQRIRMLSYYDFVAQWLMFAGVICGLLLWGSADITALFLGIGLLLPAIFLQGKIRAELGKVSVDFGGDFRQHLRFALLALPVGLFQWSLQSSDYYFIRHLYGLHALGDYSIVYNISFSFMGIFYLLHSITYPSLVRAYDRSVVVFRELLLRLQYGFLFFAQLFLLFGCFAGRPIIWLLSSHRYMGAVKYFPLVFASFYFLILSVLLLDCLNLRKCAFAILLCHGIGFVLNLVLNFYWIGRFGVIGAGYATVVAYFVVYLCLFASTYVIRGYGVGCYVWNISFLLAGAGLLLSVVCGWEGWLCVLMVVINVGLLVGLELRHGIVGFLLEITGVLKWFRGESR